ncbi:hypothetical protein EHS15_17050 [Leptospira idonii]|uniref:Uncharacterized protein n=1 Tax=Leptospira idonii TaxID=1193500 RepID=A0A4R9LY96_9LEPT|nr:hypothetical protein EHS15_17050 [Leptospira idonii]
MIVEVPRVRRTWRETCVCKTSDKAEFGEAQARVAKQSRSAATIFSYLLCAPRMSNRAKPRKAEPVREHQ